MQTLSRLNRTFAPLKRDTMVLDFVNEQAAIRASFQDYYQSTELEGSTDPNKLYNLRYTLEKMGVFVPEDVEAFADLFVAKKAKSERLQPFFQRIVAGGYVPKPDAEKEKFRAELGRYVKQYAFVSQVMTFTDAALEKFYLFAKLLLRQLPYEKQTLPLEVVEQIDMDKFRIQEERNGRILLADEDATLELTGDDGHRGGGDEAMEKLREIVKKINEEYGIEFEEADRVVAALKRTLSEDEGLKQAFSTDSVDFLRRQKLQESIKKAFLENADEFLGFMSKTETDQGFGKFFFAEMFDWYAKLNGRTDK